MSSPKPPSHPPSSVPCPLPPAAPGPGHADVRLCLLLPGCAGVRILQRGPSGSSPLRSGVGRGAGGGTVTHRVVVCPPLVSSRPGRGRGHAPSPPAPQLPRGPCIPSGPHAPRVPWLSRSTGRGNQRPARSSHNLVPAPPSKPSSPPDSRPALDPGTARPLSVCLSVWTCLFWTSRTSESVVLWLWVDTAPFPGFFWKACPQAAPLPGRGRGVEGEELPLVVCPQLFTSVCCPGDELGGGQGRPALETGVLRLLQGGVGRAGSWYSFLLGAETQTCFPEHPALCQQAWGGVRGHAGLEPGSARVCMRVRVCVCVVQTCTCEGLKARFSVVMKLVFFI